MTKKIIKRATNPLSKKLREPITLQPMPAPRSKLAQVIFSESNEKHEKDVLIAAKRNADHQLYESIQKMSELLDHYGVKEEHPNKWFLLAFNLARDHIPGFWTEIKAKSGRPKVWDGMLLLKLYLAVDKKIAEAASNGKKATLESICHHLAKEESWKSVPGCNEGVLYDRYSVARSSPLVKMLYALDEKCPGVKEKFPDFLKQAENEVSAKLS